MSGRGPLKLKGGSPLKVADSGVKKKKKKPASEASPAGQQLARTDSGSAAAAAEGDKQDITAITRGVELKAPSENEDRRTDAEKRFEQRQIKLEQERLKKLASKSHRDRVKDFNDYLANLSVRQGLDGAGDGTLVVRGRAHVHTWLTVLVLHASVVLLQEHHDIPRVGPG